MHTKGNALLVGLMLAGFGISLLAQSPDAIPPAFEKIPENAGNTEEHEDTSGPDAFDLGAPKIVQVQVEFVEMSHEALTKLLFMAKPGSANATKLRQQVQDMVAKNEAKVLETQIVCARSGQKATTEAIHEFIYPCEADVPMMPTPVDGGKSPTKVPLPTNVLPFIPSSFETRNVGSTIEIEPTIDEEGDLIDLRFIPELVWHSGNTTWLEHKDGMGNVNKIETPDFCTLRINTQLTCKDGQYMLAGTLSPKDSKGEIDLTRKVMIFVKCDILTVR